MAEESEVSAQKTHVQMGISKPKSGKFLERLIYICELQSKKSFSVKLMKMSLNAEFEG
jgi:hypothetical protein